MTLRRLLLTIFFSLNCIYFANANEGIDFTIELNTPGTLDETKLPPSDIWEFSHLYLKGSFSVEDLEIMNTYFRYRHIDIFNCKDAYFLAGGYQGLFYNQIGVLEDGTYPRHLDFFPNMIVMPKNLKKIIRNQSPNSCKIILPEGIEVIEDAGFEFDLISQINLPSTLKYIGAGALYSCEVETLRFPDHFTVIKDTCIGNVRTKIHLPNSLTEIRWHGVGFKGKSITLPKGLRRIGPVGLAGSSNLEEIHSLAETPPFCDHTLSMDELEYYQGYEKYGSDTSLPYVDKEKCILYVPKGCVEAYRNAVEWCDFKTILEEENHVEDMTGFHEWDQVEAEYSDKAGLDAITVDNINKIENIYNINGIRQENLVPGINIIKYTNGKVQKVVCP